MIKKCLICNTKKLVSYNTEITGFVLEKIEKSKKDRNTRLLKCENCGFSFYEYRMSKEENFKLYAGYRNANYQKTRQKYEGDYTIELNNSIGNDVEEVIKHRAIISKKINKYKNIRKILDYGGDKGQLIPDGVEKYVYDISGIPPLEGIYGFSSYVDLLSHKFDLIMCICVLEHIENIQEFIQSMCKVGNEKTFFYISVPNDTPFGSTLWSRIYLLLYKLYFCKRKEIIFYPMHEHINFFTKKALEIALQNVGIKIDESFAYEIKTSRGKLKFNAVIGHYSNSQINKDKEK